VCIIREMLQVSFQLLPIALINSVLIGGVSEVTVIADLAQGYIDRFVEEPYITVEEVPFILYIIDSCA
jgi:hypothetical protein